jgi:hypothetical protein
MQLKCGDRPIMVELILIAVLHSYHIAMGSILTEMRANTLSTKCIIIIMFRKD